MPTEATFDPALHDALVGCRREERADCKYRRHHHRRRARRAPRARYASATSGNGNGDGLAADVEHLEAFAFARACATARVPCARALGVANVVGSKGRAEWLAGHVGASEEAADVAWRALAAIATSLATPQNVHQSAVAGASVMPCTVTWFSL